MQAVQTMMNDIPAVSELREYSDVESALVAIGAELLAINDGTGST